MKKYEKTEVAQYTQFRCRTTGSSSTSSSSSSSGSSSGSRKKSNTGTICMRKIIEFHVLSFHIFLGKSLKAVNYWSVKILQPAMSTSRCGVSSSINLNCSWTNFLKHTSPEKNSFRQSGLFKSSKKWEQIQNTRPPLYSWSGIFDERGITFHMQIIGRVFWSLAVYSIPFEWF